MKCGQAPAGRKTSSPATRQALGEVLDGRASPSLLGDVGAVAASAPARSAGALHPVLG